MYYTGLKFRILKTIGNYYLMCAWLATVRMRTNCAMHALICFSSITTFNAKIEFVAYVQRLQRNEHTSSN